MSKRNRWRGGYLRVLQGFRYVATMLEVHDGLELECKQVLMLHRGCLLILQNSSRSFTGVLSKLKKPTTSWVGGYYIAFTKTTYYLPTRLFQLALKWLAQWQIICSTVLTGLGDSNMGYWEHG